MNNNKYKIIVMDLDGTLLRDDQTISNETIRVLENLSKAGYILVISTGRSMVGIPKEIKNIDSIDYFITSNGASCVDKDGIYVLKNWLKYDDIGELVIDNNFFVEYLISGKWYASSDDLKHIFDIIEDKNIVDYIRSTRNIIGNDLHNRSFEKINLNFSKDYYSYASKKIKNIVKNNKNIRTWTDKNHKLDIYSTVATKGNALKQLAKSINVQLSEVIAFGDDDNDLEMLSYIGCSVAMKNGNDNVRKIAKYTTAFDNNNDGVIKFIKKRPL